MCDHALRLKKAIKYYEKLDLLVVEGGLQTPPDPPLTMGLSCIIPSLKSVSYCYASQVKQLKFNDSPLYIIV